MTRVHAERSVREFLYDVQPANGFISQTFEGLYFLSDENVWLDGLLGMLESQNDSFRCLLLHCLFQACLQKRPFNLFHRANLHLRTSGGIVKFGNRTTWANPFPELMLTAYREVSRMQSSAMYLPVQIAGPVSADKIPGTFDVVYIDPPYFKHAKKTTTTFAGRNAQEQRMGLEQIAILNGVAEINNDRTLADTESQRT